MQKYGLIKTDKCAGQTTSIAQAAKDTTNMPAADDVDNHIGRYLSWVNTPNEIIHPVQGLIVKFIKKVVVQEDVLNKAILAIAATIFQDSAIKALAEFRVIVQAGGIDMAKGEIESPCRELER